MSFHKTRNTHVPDSRRARAHTHTHTHTHTQHTRARAHTQTHTHVRARARALRQWSLANTLDRQYSGIPYDKNLLRLTFLTTRQCPARSAGCAMASGLVTLFVISTLTTRLLTIRAVTSTFACCNQMQLNSESYVEQVYISIAQQPSWFLFLGLFVVVFDSYTSLIWKLWCLNGLQNTGFSKTQSPLRFRKQSVKTCSKEYTVKCVKAALSYLVLTRVAERSLYTS